MAIIITDISELPPIDAMPEDQKIQWVADKIALYPNLETELSALLG